MKLTDEGSMLINKIERGIVIDHIKAGLGVKLYYYLGLDKANFTVALITNADSVRLGRKDILKIQNIIDLDYDVIGLIDDSATINIIEDKKVRQKVQLKLPETVTNVLSCKNPRCVTTLEKLDQIFDLCLYNDEKRIYRCRYCDELTEMSI